MLHPDFLAACLLDIARDYTNKASDEVLLYFPITFTGRTSTSNTAPNHIVFETYHKFLQQLGHSIHHEDLINSFRAHGINVIDVQPSNWLIERQQHPQMWESMYHFVTGGIVLELLDRLDILSWCNELRTKGHSFQVDNVDILATIPRVCQTLQSTDLKDQDSDDLFIPRSKSTPSNRFLEYIAPRTLRISEMNVPSLSSGQILVAINSSLISPGVFANGPFSVCLISVRHGA